MASEAAIEFSVCPTTVLILVAHGGSVLDTDIEVSVRKSDVTTFRGAFESIMRTHYPGLVGHVAIKCVPCPAVCTETLAVLSSLSPYRYVRCVCFCLPVQRPLCSLGGPPSLAKLFALFLSVCLCSVGTFTHSWSFLSENFELVVEASSSRTLSLLLLKLLLLRVTVVQYEIGFFARYPKS